MRVPRSQRLQNPILQRAVEDCSGLVDAVLEGVRAGLDASVARSLLESSFSHKPGVELLTPREVRFVRAQFRLRVWDAGRHLAQAPLEASSAHFPLTPQQHAQLRLAHRFAYTLAVDYELRRDGVSSTAAPQLCAATAYLIPPDVDVSAMGALSPLHTLIAELPVASVEDLDLLTSEMRKAVEQNLAPTPERLRTPGHPDLEAFHARSAKLVDALLAERLALTPGEISATLLHGVALLEQHLPPTHPLVRFAQRELRAATRIEPGADTLLPLQLQEGLERLKRALDLFYS